MNVFDEEENVPLCFSRAVSAELRLMGMAIEYDNLPLLASPTNEVIVTIIMTRAPKMALSSEIRDMLDRAILHLAEGSTPLR